MSFPTEDELSELQQLEEELWREETRFDRQRMSQLIAEDFVEFGRSGRVYTRGEILDCAREPINAVFPLPNFQIRRLSNDIVQVTYESHVTSDGVVHYGRRSSIWSRTAAGWQLRFHQGTPFEIHQT